MSALEPSAGVSGRVPAQRRLEEEMAERLPLAPPDPTAPGVTSESEAEYGEPDGGEDVDPWAPRRRHAAPGQPALFDLE